MEAFLNVLLVSLAAGLSTGVGAIIAVLKKPSRKFTGVALGIAVGVMVGLSFIELLPEALEIGGLTIALSGFVSGAGIMLVLESALPHMHGTKPVNVKGKYDKSRLIAIGIALHNLPEGFAVGAGFAHAPEFGLMVAIAMGLHNIPEGLVVAIPMRANGASRRKAFKAAFLSGLAEPVGAVAAFFLLQSFVSAIPFALAFAAGVMVYVTLDELIPYAKCNGHEQFTSIGIIAGVCAAMCLTAWFA